MHGLSPSVKCVAPLLRDISLQPKYEIQGAGARPQRPPPPQLRPWSRNPCLFISAVITYSTIGQKEYEHPVAGKEDDYYFIAQAF